MGGQFEVSMGGSWRFLELQGRAVGMLLELEVLRGRS